MERRILKDEELEQRKKEDEEFVKAFNEVDKEMGFTDEDDWLIGELEMDDLPFMESDK